MDLVKCASALHPLAGNCAAIVFLLTLLGLADCTVSLNEAAASPAPAATTVRSANIDQADPFPSMQGGSKMNAPSLQSLSQAALQDAARRRGVDVSTLRIVMAEPVTWSDGALGCPQPGMSYTQALVPGFRIRIAAGPDILEYHASTRGLPLYCPPALLQAPTTDPRT